MRTFLNSICVSCFGLLSMGFFLTACGKTEDGAAQKELPAAAAPSASEAAPEAAETQEPKKPEASTLSNAQNAFNGESNANKRYEAFAVKADEEGFVDVANLFRAASKAEATHAASLAEIIVKMGGKPSANIVAPDVKSTAENVAAALAGETEEYTKMYPEYIEIAKAEGNMDAVRVFNGAKSAEESHAKFYKEAGDNLEAWKTDTRAFYVCGVCGYLVTTINFDNCPICFVSKDKYTKVD